MTDAFGDSGFLYGTHLMAEYDFRFFIFLKVINKKVGTAERLPQHERIPIRGAAPYCVYVQNHPQFEILETREFRSTVLLMQCVPLS